MIYLAESLKKILNGMSCPKRLAYSITNVKEKKL
jgi:hypothetical protein